MRSRVIRGEHTLRSSLERSCEVDRGMTWTSSESKEETLDESDSPAWEPSNSSEDMSAVESKGIGGVGWVGQGLIVIVLIVCQPMKTIDKLNE